MDTIEILKQIISIPSWVDKKTNEQKIGEWIFGYLKKNSTLKIYKQPVGNGRFNVIAQKGNRADILITGHMDTVRPASSWTKKPTNPEISKDKLYGSGSTDMKSGVAVMLSLTTNLKLKDNIMFLFYCDEEYDFLGMRKFIGEYKDKIKPELVISLDGGGLQIGNSCRGLIELKVKVLGKAGHAANPKSGINAITQSFKVINQLKKWLKDYSTKELGNSTLNIAYINGGGSEGNIIAEKCEYIVEIRVTDKNLSANLVKQFITDSSEKFGLQVKEIKIRHDLGSWTTSKDDLKDLIWKAPRKILKSAKKSGYIDIQMLWKAFGKVPTFSLGAGESRMSHKADEYVKISNVLKAQEFYKSILTNK